MSLAQGLAPLEQDIQTKNVKAAFTTNNQLVNLSNSGVNCYLYDTLELKTFYKNFIDSLFVPSLQFKINKNEY